MSNRGRGRGARGASKSSISTIATNLGIEKHDLRSPPPVLNPPSLYPHLENKPLPIVLENDFYTKDDLEYIGELKQEFLSTMHNSLFFCGDDESSKSRHLKISRFSDNLRKSTQNASWQPDWNRLPRELWPSSLKQGAKDRKVATRGKRKLAKVDTVTYLKELEAREQAAETVNIAAEDNVAAGEHSSDDTEGEGGGAGGEIADLEAAGEEDEHDLEEFNDYIDTYFDNGEDFEENVDENPDDQNTF